MQLVDLPAIDFCLCNSCVRQMKYIAACMHIYPTLMYPMCIECCPLYDSVNDMSLYCNAITAADLTGGKLIYCNSAGN